ncbi:hypothetical protein L596_019282 [Steinernema carpocapsae]|uniref:Uncharacterized protein n=1 Tax=Steinernema carpocapsae TaxID=34508 RepID=A0A4U5MQZ3_STECR|nr:hypothetical protein L596_019282 [Steinernema carpocapsae]
MRDGKEKQTTKERVKSKANDSKGKMKSLWKKAAAKKPRTSQSKSLKVAPKSRQSKIFSVPIVESKDSVIPASA